jgi:aminoglycoside phosphotransferase (APT) family kinase protein
MSDTRDFVGTMPVVERLRFEVAPLEAWMREHVDGFRGPLAVEQFRGGQSNPTYRLSAPGGRYVLRRKPPGKLLPSAHAVDREYRVITALGKTGFPVPRSYALCLDDGVIGTAFFIMDYVEGRVFWDPALADLDRAERAPIYDAMNETIARLHQTDYAAIGLADFGRPGNYVARQIDRWTKQYRASETERIEAMDHLIEWLPKNVPADEEVSLVHGDFRLDNMIFDARSPRILAVLDWELSTLGNPLGDFAYHAMSWRLPPGSFRGLGEENLAALGIPSEEEYRAAYCRRTGRKEILHWDFYMAYNMFRLAAILQGIMGRVREGTAASLKAQEAGERAKVLAALGWQQAQRLGV